jgi:hypothetical protein
LWRQSQKGKQNNVSLTVPLKQKNVADSTEINGVVPRAGFEQATNSDVTHANPFFFFSPMQKLKKFFSNLMKNLFLASNSFGAFFQRRHC